MSNTLLKPLFFDVYGHKIDPKKFGDRLKMQKMIFLFQEAGRNVGDYDFSWYKHGPYSRSLQFDILDLDNTKEKKIKYTQESERVKDAIKKLMSKKRVYKEDEWAEAVTSILYLKKYMVPIDITDEGLIEELKNKKPELNNEEENKLALNAVREYSREIGERTYFG